MSRYAPIVFTALILAVAPWAASAQQGLAPVISKKVARVSMPTQSESLGTTRANESLDVTSKVSERIRSIHFSEGQLVKAGQVLVQLDTDEASANLAVASADLSESSSNFQRATELDRTKSISQSELKQLESRMNADKARVQAARARLADLTITAPFAGNVGLRRVSAGSLVSPGTLITTLDDLGTIKLDFSLPESLLAQVSPGLAIEATSIAYPGVKFLGTVASVDTRVDPVTRSVVVRALIPNSDAMLRPGMLLSVVLTQQATSSLVIPEQAVISEQNRQFVYVIKDSQAEKREIRTGRRLPGLVEILDGLAENEVIVVEGTQRLRPGAGVEVTRELTPDETSS